MLLDSSTLTYKVFTDPRSIKDKEFEEGFSGTLFVATDKSGKKYLVKHQECTDAGNEYVASFIARKMGIPAAKAHILTPDDRLFSHFAVAIDFMDGLERCRLDDPELTEQEKKDIVLQNALALLLDNSDTVELYKYKGRVVQVDMADSFSINGFMIVPMYAAGHPEMARQMLGNYITHFAENVHNQTFQIPTLAKWVSMDEAEVEELVYSAFRKVVDITDEEKEEVYKDLKSIYTHDMAMHYIKAIEVLQERFGDSDE